MSSEYRSRSDILSSHLDITKSDFMYFGRLLSDLNYGGIGILTKKDKPRNLVKIEISKSPKSSEEGESSSSVVGLKIIGKVNYTEGKGKARELFTEDERKVL